jgi:hypothetical protein
VKSNGEGEHESSTTTTNDENSDNSKNKKQKIETENTLKSEFDISARKYIDWIDNIERILDEKTFSQAESHKRQDIIQVKILLYRLIN